MWKSSVEAILGGKMVEKVRIRSDGKAEEIACAGVFAYVGLEPNAGFAPSGIPRDASGHLLTDGALETAMAGIWAIGAVRAGYSGLLRDDANSGVARPGLLGRRARPRRRRERDAGRRALAGAVARRRSPES